MLAPRGSKIEGRSSRIAISGLGRSSILDLQSSILNSSGAELKLKSQMLSRFIYENLFSPSPRNRSESGSDPGRGQCNASHIFRRRITPAGSVEKTGAGAGAYARAYARADQRGFQS